MSDKKPDTSPKGPPPWMLSLADLISLLLTFFVMLFAMSTVKVDAWNEIIDSMSKAAVDIENPEETDAPQADNNISTTIRKPAMNLDYLKSILTNNLKNDDVLGDAMLRQESDRLVLSLPGDLLFVSGQAALTRQAQQALFRLGGVLSNIGNKVGVQGHSDPVPLSGQGRFTSNWELSLSRAISVANSLKASGYPGSISVYGFADSRFDRISSDLPDQQRFIRARRVDIVVESHSGSGFGDF